MPRKKIKLPASGHHVWKQRGGLHDPRPNRRRQRGQAKRRAIDDHFNG